MRQILRSDWLFQPSHGSQAATVRSSRIQRQRNLPSFLCFHDPPTRQRRRLSSIGRKWISVAPSRSSTHRHQSFTLPIHGRLHCSKEKGGSRRNLAIHHLIAICTIHSPPHPFVHHAQHTQPSTTITSSLSPGQASHTHTSNT